MQISELARQSGVPAKTIRYYESVGLLPTPARADNNYRSYEAAVLERLRFIASTRSLGFSLTDIGEMLAARDAGDAPCERVLEALDAQLVQPSGTPQGVRPEAVDRHRSSETVWRCG